MKGYFFSWRKDEIAIDDEDGEKQRINDMREMKKRR